ncbi:PREDICTED: uncharacterized protein LOC109465455 [Branchiostoma belcheri]|uniref:Uncharacterized protein LOC109465455 n=1 Tax=Branchiostoma belcheri TaxID=7741 RepID=A0A6P4YHR6_BRABE|nr:PREDICTED: uncharacterized protein LOC109465455 [Branchiostoma belcheri]
MLALAAAAVTSDRPCFPGCQRADWSACIGDITESNIIPPGLTDQAFCMTCNTTPTLSLDMACLNDTPRGFAVRGRPLHVLSDLKPPHFCAARVAVLGLIDGNITDVDMPESFLVSGYTHLLKLALNSNNLTHVRRSWFKGLETLSHLSLSNNQIDRIEPGCFADLPRLVLLNLDNNLLHDVEADWFPRSHKLAYLYLSSNRIDRVPADALQNLQDLSGLSLGRNHLSCLHNEVVCGLDNLRQLYMSGNRMVTMYGGTSSGVMWSLVRKNDFRRGDIVKQKISFEVPHLLLCLVHDPDKNEQSLKWMFDVSPTVPRHTTAGFPDSCSVRGDSVTYTGIIRQPPFVVVAGVSDKNVQNRPEQCREMKVRGENLSRLSLPAVLHTIDPTYSEIPDDIAAAHRPLPALPHTYSEIPDAATFGLVRSASFPPTSTTHGEVTSGEMVHMSLPSGLHSIEPTYSEIPDAVAAAWRPLPAIPRANWESEGDVAASQSLPSRPHTYSEIPDDRDSGPVSALAHAGQACSEVHAVRNRGRNRLSYQNNVLSTPRRYIPTYGAARQIKARGVALYNCAEVQGVRGGREPNARGLRHHGTPRRVSLPTVTLPNTYWPWEIPGEGIPNTPRRASLPTVTPPNTYWPWEIPEEGTRNTSRRASLPAVIPPNTYWPWEIPGEGTNNTAERALPPTLPNNYWPWEIPGEGTRSTAQRGSLPAIIPPNTYWPWEIPGEGTRNTARRVSFSTVTLPNTYWPWEIPGEGTRNSAERALPHTLPNTYWPWEIPGEGTRNTARPASLPTVTLPNTYWPWEIPGEGTRNSAERALPHTLPNTYWPWEIEGEETRNTAQPASLSTLPNTYWPWEISGEGTHNTARRASLPN